MGTAVDVAAGIGLTGLLQVWHVSWLVWLLGLLFRSVGGATPWTYHTCFLAACFVACAGSDVGGSPSPAPAPAPAPEGSNTGGDSGSSSNNGGSSELGGEL